MLEILFPHEAPGRPVARQKTAEVRSYERPPPGHAAALGHFEAHARRGCGEAGQASQQLVRRGPEEVAMKKNTTPSPDADAPMGYGYGRSKSDLPRHRR